MPPLDSRFGSDFPGSFFRSRELNEKYPLPYSTLDGLWDVLLEEQEFDLSDASSAGVLRSQTMTGSLFFRGQSDEGFGLSSSLHRLVESETGGEMTEGLLSSMESAVLEDARARGLGKMISPGQLLMILQHHAAPTRLIDVSLKPLEALYFAVEKADRVDGRLFTVYLNRGGEGSTTVRLSGRADLPWSAHRVGQARAAAEWTQSVKLVDEEPLDPRMIAQRGRFLVGGVHRAYANLNMWFDDKQLRIVERQKISMLCINFPLRDFQSAFPGGETGWPAIAWTIRIPGEWKPELRRRLRSRGIHHESIYPDLASIGWRAEAAARSALAASQDQ